MHRRTSIKLTPTHIGEHNISAFTLLLLAVPGKIYHTVLTPSQLHAMFMFSCCKFAIENKQLHLKAFQLPIGECKFVLQLNNKKR